MPKLKPGTLLPTDDEDKKIRNAVTKDPDARLLEDGSVKLSSWRTLKAKRKQGRPIAAETKTRITIRCSPDVVNAFRATGAGWQTRMDVALKDWLKKHNPSDVKIR
ncbi:MAG TPA: BrnA antitoxin family protein [Arsenophonus nasoniae]|uniref:BrnA antitoxin family protein n=1 Tax=Arsenophonus nasoniae TaxID=638 RepID=UPI00387A756F